MSKKTKPDVPAIGTPIVREIVIPEGMEGIVVLAGLVGLNRPQLLALLDAEADARRVGHDGPIKELALQLIGGPLEPDGPGRAYGLELLKGL